MNNQFSVTQRESKFTGGVLGLIGINILETLLIIFTLAIGTPWAICMSERWRIKHTIIDGKRLVFDGTGGQLFGKWLLWLLLTFITLGIFALWLPIAAEKWKVSHTHVLSEEY